jgi:hypothetical protein
VAVCQALTLGAGDEFWPLEFVHSCDFGKCRIANRIIVLSPYQERGTDSANPRRLEGLAPAQ